MGPGTGSYSQKGEKVTSLMLLQRELCLCWHLICILTFLKIFFLLLFLFTYYYFFPWQRAPEVDKGGCGGPKLSSWFCTFSILLYSQILTIFSVLGNRFCKTIAKNLTTNNTEKVQKSNSLGVKSFWNFF